MSASLAGAGFGRLIRAHRQRKLLSQEQLAERAGLSLRAVGYLEAGRKQRPRLATVRRLADALALDGDERAGFEQAALAIADALRDSPSPAPATRPPAVTIPAQLPGDVVGFVGRDRELAALDSLTHLAVQPGTQPGTQPGSELGSEPGTRPGVRPATPVGARVGDRGPSTALVVAAVSGTAGVGKTALVLHWAHRRLERFPDGQLFVDLRGYSLEGPVQPADALARLLTGLGVPPAVVPFDLDERADLFRTTVAGRRLLIVLDNARSVEQVRPLLPGAPSCLVVVTSRQSLGGLVARHGARRLDVDLLEQAEAERLLAGLIGDRAGAEPEALRTLAEQCARLPLALRVAAELAAGGAGASLADLTVELADEERRLQLLDADGDPGTAVQAVLSWSYRRLPPATARAFRAFGRHAGPDVDARAVAALTDGDVGHAARALRELRSGHLIAQTRPGRYWMHDLLHAFAGRLAREADDDAGSRAGLEAYYTATAEQAGRLAFPAGAAANRPLTEPVSAPSPLTPAFPDGRSALAWLDDERPVLAHPSWRPPPPVSAALSFVLASYLYDGGHTVDALTVHERALEGARAVGDRQGEAAALQGLTMTYWRWGRLAAAADFAEQAIAAARSAGDLLIEGHAVSHRAGISGQRARYEEAERFYAESLSLFRRAGTRFGEASSLLNLGVVHERRGEFEQAIGFYQSASALAEEIGYVKGQARAWFSLAEIARELGRDEAGPHYRRSIDLARACGASMLEAQSLDGLGHEHRRQGRLDEAKAAHQAAFELFAAAGSRVGEGWALDGLGAVLVVQGRPIDALNTYRQALQAFEETDAQTGTISSRNGLGDALLALGRVEEASASYEDARRRAEGTGDRSELARALTGLGDAGHGSGDDEDARRWWQQALRLYTELAMVEADALRARLEAPGDPRAAEAGSG